MDLSSLTRIGENALTGSQPFKVRETGDNSTTFESLFDSALSLIKETDLATNKVEEEEMKFAVGQDNLLELQAAQTKASTMLQYTVAVKNTVMDAYKEIMNMQF